MRKEDADADNAQQQSRPMKTGIVGNSWPRALTSLRVVVKSSSSADLSRTTGYDVVPPAAGAITLNRFPRCR